MGCSSENAKEEKPFQKTGDPKRDFFYCFDDQEVKIIEERRKQLPSCPEATMQLYSRFEIDYAKEKDENLIVKQYIAICFKLDFDGEYYLDDIQNFNIKACDIIGFKINNKKATFPTFNTMDGNWAYCGISLYISDGDRVEPFKDLLIFEITYKIKQYRLYNTRQINLHHSDDPYTSSMIIYYDKNKMEVESKEEENLIPLKNGVKYFNRKENFFWIRNKGKIQFSKEEEKLIKKIFTSEEITNIYTAFDKIGALKGNNNLIFETFKYTFNNEGISKGEGKTLVIANERFGRLLIGSGYNFKITELKINDKLIEKKPMDYYHEDQLTPINYFQSDNGDNNTYLNDLKSLVIIEFKIELVPLKNEENDENDKYSFDFKSLFGVEYLSGGYYNYEIVPNKTNLIFEPDEERYATKKTGNSIIYSGFYNVDLKEYDDLKYIKETNQVYENDEQQKADKDNRLREWLDTKKLPEFHPLKFRIE